MKNGAIEKIIEHSEKEKEVFKSVNEADMIIKNIQEKKLRRCDFYPRKL